MLYENVPYSNNAHQNIMDIYLPDCEEFDVLIYIHGGGLEKGSKRSVGPMAEMLNKAGIAVFAPTYRLYPEAVFPDFIEDSAMAVDFVLKEACKYGKPKSFFLGGSSAGAYITAMLAYDTSYFEKYGIKTSDFAGFIINSAQMTTHYNVLRERGLDTRRIVVDEAAPVYHITEKSEFPRILIVNADRDMTCRYEQNQMFIKALEHFGCPKEKIKFILMKNSRHCSYDKSEEYAKIVENFIKEDT